MADPILIVGAGLTGCTLAERLASAGRSVWLIDQRPHIAGMAYDEYNAAGILVHRYGPHIFHTNSTKVWTYLSRFTTWRPYQHRVRAAIDGQLVPVPINRTTLAMMGRPLEEVQVMLFESYTRKQWGPDGVDRSVWARVAPRVDSDDDRYFLDTYQAMPSEGYTVLAHRMLASPLIRVSLNTRWEDVRDEWGARPLVFTGPIDAYFGQSEGPLPYRSTRLRWETFESAQHQPVACVNYPDESVPHTRCTEYKHLTGQHHACTTVSYERTDATGEPTHPVPKPEHRTLYERYAALARRVAPQVTFAGRLGTYKYLDMDQCVGQALVLADRLTQGVAA